MGTLTESKRSLVTGLAILCVAAGVFAWLAAAVPYTADEPGYILAGRAIVTDGGFVSPQERLQGPLGLVANQLLVDSDALTTETLADVRVAARLGLVPFALLLLVVVWRWAHAVWGARGGLLALGCAALSPTLLAYGALVAVDTAFAATAMLTLWLLWRWACAPSPGRLAAWGAALGLCLGTKYLALIVAAALPCVVVAVGLVAPGRAWLPFARSVPERPRVLGAAHALGGAALAGIVALLALHACYGFRAPWLGFDPAVAAAVEAAGAESGESGLVAILRSGALRAVASLPGGGLLLGALPTPMVLGADYQAAVSKEFSSVFAGKFSAHWAYYLVAIATKTALPFLLLAALGKVSFVRALRGAGPRPWELALVIAIPAGVLLLYLSLLSNLQIGLRYALLVYPLMALVAGAWVRDAVATTRRVAVAGAALAVMLATDVASAPHFLGSFNMVVGGPVGGHRVFLDSNVDWSQHLEFPAGLREGPLGDGPIVRGSGGPRFGTFAVRVVETARRDPLRPTHLYHWTRRFEPVDHWVAAWLVYSLTAADFEAAIASGDERAAADLAWAHVRAGDFVAAQNAAVRAPAAQRGALTESVEGLARLADLDPATAEAAAERARLVPALYVLDQADLALEVLDGAAGAGERTQLFVALWAAGDASRAVDLLRERAAESALSTEEALLLAGGLFEFGRFGEARDVLDAHARPETGHPLRAIYETLRARIVESDDAMRRLRGGTGR